MFPCLAMYNQLVIQSVVILSGRFCFVNLLPSFPIRKHAFFLSLLIFFFTSSFITSLGLGQYLETVTLSGCPIYPQTMSKIQIHVLEDPLVPKAPVVPLYHGSPHTKALWLKATISCNPLQLLSFHLGKVRPFEDSVDTLPKAVSWFVYVHLFSWQYCKI